MALTTQTFIAKSTKIIKFLMVALDLWSSSKNFSHLFFYFVEWPDDRENLKCLDAMFGLFLLFSSVVCYTVEPGYIEHSREIEVGWV